MTRATRSARRRERRPAGRRRLGSHEPTVTPLYHQVYLALREGLRNQEFDAGGPLPGEHELARRFGVSRVTVRRALQQLDLEGLVERRHGAGTFPAARPTDLRDRYNIGGLRDAAAAGAKKAAINTLSAGLVPAPARIVALFGAAASPILRIERQRAVGGGEPFTLLTTWVHPRHAARLGGRHLRSAEILGVLERSGIAMTRAEQAVSARAAGEREAALLGVPPGAPLLVMTTLFTDPRGAAVAYLEALYRPDRYEYRLTMLRGSGRAGERWRMAE